MFMDIRQLLLTSLCCLIAGILAIMRERKRIGLNKFTEALTVIVPKGTVVRLKGYAILKGYKNESELIAHLVEKEMEKDRKNINMKDE